LSDNSAVEHGQVVLSAIIPGRRDLLDKAMLHLTPDHFTDMYQSKIFDMMERYYRVTGQVLTSMALKDLLAKAKAHPDKVKVYTETLELLSETQTAESDFSWSVEQLKDLKALRETQQALTESMQILTKGVSEGKDGEKFGHEDARSHLIARLAEIDRELHKQASPEGDVRDEQDEILREYLEVKERKHEVGIKFGIENLDNKLGGGLGRGELALVVGGSSSGKTSLATIQLAWHAAVMQGKNVFIATSETIRPVVRRKLYCRHSRHPLFLERCPDGLNSRDAKDGTFTMEEEEIFQDVVRDFTTNPNYGKIHVVQVPKGATMDFVESRMIMAQRDFNVDLAIVDYFALLKSERKRQQDREELSSILKAAKNLTTSFNDGHGVTMISPWQVNRTWWEKASEVGYYTTAALAETAEATNSPDVIISILEPRVNDQREVDLKGQILKNRDGEKSVDLPIHVDYATAWFTAISSGFGPSNSDPFTSLI
jgi:replicative DNA helicase